MFCALQASATRGSNKSDFPAELSEHCNLQQGSVYLTERRDENINWAKETERKIQKNIIRAIRIDNKAKPACGKKYLCKKCISEFLI